MYTRGLGGENYQRNYYGKYYYIPDSIVPARSFGHYHVLSSQTSYSSFIFDDVNKTQLDVSVWYPDGSSPSSTTVNSFSLGNPWCVEIDSSNILIIPG